MESEEKKMSYYTLSNKELSQLIRKDLKKHGFLKEVLKKILLMEKVMLLMMKLLKQLKKPEHINLL